MLFNFTYISIKRNLLKWFFSIHFVSKILISKEFSIFRKKHENLMNALILLMKDVRMVALNGKGELLWKIKFILNFIK